ncbi:hypothetical protein [Maribellus mangrovi]|uniref:hypothetical protein n=1 Tax=Maribellus mangrovi TaxID=3133146 RepID=UPI0030EC5B57
MNLYGQDSWQSRRISYENNELKYNPDEKGNTIPDFGRVGYHEGGKIPNVRVVKEVSPGNGDDFQRIQDAINRVESFLPDENGFRGAVLLKNGLYEVSQTLIIRKSGVVLRGENKDKTVLKATKKAKYNLIEIQGTGDLIMDEKSKKTIHQKYVPVGAKKLVLASTDGLQNGNSIIVYRPGTKKWLHDLKMDQIEDNLNLRQWTEDNYDLLYERKIEKISGDTIQTDYPVVMAMEEKYGGGSVYRYDFKGRISECGIENLYLKSTYENETDENHAWIAIKLVKAQNCWIKNVTARFFGYSCVSVANNSRNITVTDCNCLDPKSEIIGGRRYAFECDGQLNLFKRCFSTYGRHDFVTGRKVCGPNVFTQCEAVNSQSDIGPHHRWATGTLYDVIKTDRSISVQDRGNYGTGHGWAGANQVFWNCKAKTITAQNPWVSAKNYVIGGTATKLLGRFPDRPDGNWEGLNRGTLKPESLYEAQKKACILKNQEH